LLYEVMRGVNILGSDKGVRGKFIVEGIKIRNGERAREFCGGKLDDKNELTRGGGEGGRWVFYGWPRRTLESSWGKVRRAYDILGTSLTVCWAGEREGPYMGGGLESLNKKGGVWGKGGGVTMTISGT